VLPRGSEDLRKLELTRFDRCQLVAQLVTDETTPDDPIVATLAPGVAVLPSPSAPPVESAPPRRLNLYPLGLAVFGIALGVTGSALAISSGDDYDRLRSTCGVTQTCSPSSYQGPELRANVGWALIGVGAAAATAGIIWWIARPHQPQKDRTWIAPTIAGALAGGTF
jgi:hypothetical protein